MSGSTQQHKITVPASDLDAAMKAIERASKSFHGRIPDAELQATKESFIANINRMVCEIDDAQYNAMLKRIYSLDEDANEDESESESDNEVYSDDDDDDSIEEELLLDEEVIQRVERLRNEVATAAQNIRDLRAKIPKRSLELSKREMDMLMTDKEALLHAAELQNNSDSRVNVLGNLTNSIPVDGMQESLSKLSKAIICEKELSDKLESVQRTVDSIEVAMKTKASEVDLAMMMNEEEETYRLKQAVEHQSLSACDILTYHVERK
uniref:Uncharacterized protein n=1 Tax=Leptocylindrus danicus TaxID=163516 RepID=A0A7S2K231_9STRA|mmetsp:Transcript_16280/g.23984  ORF Transcript_16280/g.23984 Transcript_16280/m.23984 type:complete len:266 (+) Transcript_16280:106-903(+)|eukprot:CAMPEP_0116037862 /NCGR_PEP_ID=MMETSP0321-20121206/22357_1 /TAXON_ID=163516 /ORGANISM="Leptocylindrus danicus var. danicus, Strain B650" /LENGTH=265 /DNA_ID=CAMNT_0003516249 /DNA_START=17 /DNA_END=814 /DNA_ORIENTATION=+